MTAGMNVRGTVWWISASTDDDVGGAVITGTSAYRDVYGRLTPQSVTTLLLEQGIEAEKLWNLELRPPSMVIRERDEFEITFPPMHWNYGERFRVVSVKYPSMHPSDSRGSINLVVKRRERAHANQ
jgi:hypothetical protein